jgi:hypothetical protein
MKRKIKNVFTQAAILLFERPSIVFSCHAINRVLDVNSGNETNEKTLYKDLFLGGYYTFDDLYKRLFGCIPDSEELHEVRILALLFASHILSEEEPSPYVIAAENIFNRTGTDFSCVAIKHAVNNGEQFPTERIQYQDVFECENHVFETIYKRYYPQEYTNLQEDGYDKYSEEMREIRVLALLFADQYFKDNKQ